MTLPFSSEGGLNLSGPLDAHASTFSLISCFSLSCALLHCNIVVRINIVLCKALLCKAVHSLHLPHQESSGSSHEVRDTRLVIWKVSMYLGRRLPATYGPHEGSLNVLRTRDK